MIPDLNAKSNDQALATNEDMDAVIEEIFQERMRMLLEYHGVEEWSVCGINLDTVEGKVKALVLADINI